MGTLGRPRRGRLTRASDGTQQHRGWLELIDVSGPFLSLPVLQSAWPTLDALEKPAREKLRLAHATWQSDGAVGQRSWIDYVLGELLGWGNELRWHEGDDLDHLSMGVAEHDTRIVPVCALVAPGGEISPATTEVLGLVCEPGLQPTARIPHDLWAATPVDRLARLCRHHGIELGIATDGRWWTLVWARRGKVTTTVTFDAVGWADAAERDVVRAFVSLLCRRRFFGVSDHEKLVTLLAKSEDSQEEITEALGVQVRQAVELLVAAIGRSDTAQPERGEPGLEHIDAEEIYRGAVTVMMRVVFLLFAEERKMLPSDNELYATSYSAGQLCSALEQRALAGSEDDLEHTSAGWQRLLALFHAVYWGVEHPRLHMYPHDGSLFDSMRFPWLRHDIDDRTVLHMLRAVQFVEVGTGRSRERRKLSFRELDVEQIGYVYEGLLGHDGFRADEVTVSLAGKPGLEQEVPLRELEQFAARAQDLPELAAALAQEFKDSGIGAARALERRLAPAPAAEKEEQRRKLLSVTRGDHLLAERLSPFAGILRADLRGLPVVIMPGELFVTESSLRKNTGTHYTPRHLAEEVVTHALEPLVYSPGPLQTADQHEWKPKTCAEILALKVVDIAVGSGAFLVSAARYLGDRLVEAWAREGDERAMTTRISQVAGDGDDHHLVTEARRQAIEHCLYGVDINPMAVEMAKVSLWLISMDSERPFTFLDDRLKSGDSLLGITSLDQLWNMHLEPEIGRAVHNDLFQWTGPGRALMEKMADQRLRIIDIPVNDDPLGGLAEKRKLLAEIDTDTMRLRLFASLLIGSALFNAPDGSRGLTRGAVEAAWLAAKTERDGQEGVARERSQDWLNTGRPTFGSARAPMHWPLEFPEVFKGGGFDSVIGNNPYLGGQKLTGILGNEYREYMVHTLAGGVRGSADLIAYFALRAGTLLGNSGTLGLIATNTLAQGGTREVGLDQFPGRGLTLYRAVTSRPWPSRSAALQYCVAWATRAQPTDLASAVIDDLVVSGILPSLAPKSRATGEAKRLIANAGRSFQGATILGLGFTMSPDDAEYLIHQDPRNSGVLFPYLNGQDLNSDPRCMASRWVINFHDWPEDQARIYRECYERVQFFVKPERERNNRKVYRDHWWQYAERRPALRRAISELERVIVIARVSRTAMPMMVPTGPVFNEKIVVFASDDPSMLAVLSSAVHYRWAGSRCATLKADLQYAPSDAFETFPLPELTDEIRTLGNRLDEFRRDVMLSRNSGLTKTYNLVFDSFCTDADIEELRQIHRAIDIAAIRAYGWEDRIKRVGGLEHGFHRLGRETRYTIGPDAQREILDSLLELNHERHGMEVAQGPHSRKKRKSVTDRSLF